MDELEPCMENPAGRGCEAFSEELRDVEGFRALLRAFLEGGKGGGDGGSEGSGGGGVSASGLLVGLHNIVTSTVDPEFGGQGRHKFYCAREAMEKLSQSLVPEAKEVALNIPSDLHDKVPGFGVHRLRNCSQ